MTGHYHQWLLVAVLTGCCLGTHGSHNVLLSNEISPMNQLPTISQPQTLEKENLSVSRRSDSDEFQELLISLFDGTRESASNIGEGRGKKKKLKKYSKYFLLPTLIGLKAAILGLLLPAAIIVAKALSWKAVTISLLAFLLAKMAFLKNMFIGNHTPSHKPPPPPPSPIVIHSSSSGHESWKRSGVLPKIHLQPEVHVHHASPDHHSQYPSYPPIVESHSTNPWSYADSEGRSVSDPHILAFQKR